MVWSDLISPAISGGVTLVVAFVGWMWHLSTHSSKMDYMEKRIGALEDASTRRNARIEDMADRLARIEPAIEILVDYIKVRTSQIK